MTSIALSTPALVRALPHEPNPANRSRVVADLRRRRAQLTDDEHLVPVIDVATTPSEPAATQQHAVAILAAQDRKERLVEILQAMLQDARAGHQRHLLALRLLKDLYAPQLTLPVFERLATPGSDAALRPTAIEIMGIYKNLRCLPALLSYGKEKDPVGVTARAAIDSVLSKTEGGRPDVVWRLVSGAVEAYGEGKAPWGQRLMKTAVDLINGDETTRRYIQLIQRLVTE